MPEGVLAVCLARGGSKGIPKKNIHPVAGKPLLAWCCGAAVESGIFDGVYVSTDAEYIAQSARASGFLVHDRDPATATDKASSESGIADFFNAHPECEVLCLLQATSPQTTADDLKKAYASFLANEADSLVTVVRAHRFLWKVDSTGVATPQNYKPEKRPLRQEWDGELMENGAFYFFTREAFERTGSRLSGKIVAHEMDADAFVEIDEVGDLLFLENMFERKYGKTGAKAAPAQPATRGVVMPPTAYPRSSYVAQSPSYVPPPFMAPLGTGHPAIGFPAAYPGMYPGMPLGMPG